MSSAKRIFVAAAMAAALSALPANAAPDGFGQLAGTGTASGGGCSGPFVLTGVSTAPNVWAFTVAYAGAGGAICGAAGAPIATGTWNPATGGCVSGSAGLVCVGKVTATGTPVTATVGFSIPAQATYNGSGTVVRL